MCEEQQNRRRKGAKIRHQIFFFGKKKVFHLEEKYKDKQSTKLKEENSKEKKMAPKLENKIFSSKMVFLTD